MILQTIAPQLTRSRRQEPLARVDSPLVAVGHLARDVEVIDHTTPCTALAGVFASGYVTSVAIADPNDQGRLGLISRERFQVVSAGTLGFGRALLSRRPVTEIADWEPLSVAPRTALVDVVHRAMRRPAGRRLDDVLVEGEVWAVVSTSDLVRILAEVTAARWSGARTMPNA